MADRPRPRELGLWENGPALTPHCRPKSLDDCTVAHTEVILGKLVMPATNQMSFEIAFIIAQLPSMISQTTSSSIPRPRRRNSFPFSHSAPVSPVDFQRQLKRARIERRGGLARLASRRVGGVANWVHISHVKPVEDIKCVGDDLHVPTFAKRNLPGNAQIELGEARPGESVSSQIARAAERRRDVRQLTDWPQRYSLVTNSRQGELYAEYIGRLPSSADSGIRRPETAATTTGPTEGRSVLLLKFRL